MTTTFPDLTQARTQVEALMADTVIVERDPPGPRDDTLDPDTLALTPPAGDTDTIYDGKALITPLPPGGDRDGAPLETVRRYRALLPLDTPEVRLRDRLTVTASARDPQLAGRVFRVVDVAASTFAVARDLALEQVRT